jgi:phosphomannomutase
MLVNLRISQVGLRGVVGSHGLTASHVMEFAAAFGTFLPAGGAVVVGRDPRSSGAMIEQGALASLMACGHDCIRLGVVSTPVIQHTIRRLGAAGGISIGASHNSAEWNALKFFGPDGTYLSTAEAGELLDIYHLKKFAYTGHGGIGKVREETSAIEVYLEVLASAYDFERIRKFKVVVDCCNGTSSLILRALNDRYGFRFILINSRLEGSAFAHEPATNTKTVALQLAPLVEPVGADAGFVFDVDSDRIGIAAENGVPVSAEMVLPMLTDHALPKSREKVVITNLSTTALVEEVARRHSALVVRVPVGRQAAMDALANYGPERVAIAGEGNGGIMLSKFRFVYDGIAAMFETLEMMAERSCPLSAIVASFPVFSMLEAKVPLASRRIPTLLSSLEEEFSDGTPNVLDGLRIDWPDRWFHVRVSQTEPIVRLICEQRGAPPRALFDSLLERVEADR